MRFFLLHFKKSQPVLLTYAACNSIVLFFQFWALVAGGHDNHSEEYCKQAERFCIASWSMCDTGLMTWNVSTLVVFALLTYPLYAIGLPFGFRVVLYLFSWAANILGVCALVYRSESCFQSDSKAYTFTAVMLAFRFASDVIAIILEQFCKSCLLENIQRVQEIQPIVPEVTEVKLQVSIAHTRCIVCRLTLDDERSCLKLQHCDHVIHRECESSLNAQKSCPKCRV
jgi:hypothetical protein